MGARQAPPLVAEPHRGPTACRASSAAPERHQRTHAPTARLHVARSWTAAHAKRCGSPTTRRRRPKPRADDRFGTTPRQVLISRLWLSESGETELDLFSDLTDIRTRPSADDDALAAPGGASSRQPAAFARARMQAHKDSEARREKYYGWRHSLRQYAHPQSRAHPARWPQTRDEHGGPRGAKTQRARGRAHPNGRPLPLLMHDPSLTQVRGDSVPHASQGL